MSDTLAPTDTERLAVLEAEIQRLKDADPAVKQQTALMAGPILSAQARENERAQLADIRARRAQVEHNLAVIELERRVHAPEIAKHERKLGVLDGEIAKAAAAFEAAEKALIELQVKRRELAANPPWIAPSPFPPSMPIQVGPDHARDAAHKKRRFRGRSR